MCEGVVVETPQLSETVTFQVAVVVHCPDEAFTVTKAGQLRTGFSLSNTCTR